MEQSNSDDMIGLIGLVAAGLALWFIYSSAPISLYCLGSFGLSAIFKAMEKSKKANPDAKTLLGKTMWGICSDARRLFFAFGVGAAGAWVIQILLRIGPFGPDQAGDFQIHTYELAEGLKGWTSLPVTLAAMLLLLGASLCINSFWPLNLLARVRKASGLLAGFAAALASFGFVGVAANAQNYAPIASEIRARVVTDIGTLIEARKHLAALQWLDATLAREPAEPAEIEATSRYFGAGILRCDNADRAFASGYEAGSGRPAMRIRRYSSIPSFCSSSSYARDMAGALAERKASGAAPAPATSWVPDLVSEIRPVTASPDQPADASNPQPGFDLVATLHSYADLTHLLERVAAKLNDAEAARAAVEKDIGKQIAKRVNEQLKPYIPEIAAAWLERFVEQVAEEGVAKAGERTRLLSGWMRPMPEAAAEFLRISPDAVTIERPSERIRRAGSLAKAVAPFWARFLEARQLPPTFDASAPTLAELGGHVAQADEERRAEAARQAIATQRMIERTRVEAYRAYHPRGR